MLLVGNFQHTLDDKNRIRLPAEFRKSMGNDYMIMPGTNGSIFVYRADKAESLINELLDATKLDPDLMLEYTHIMAFSRVVEADSQGRFMIPDDLLEIMSIHKEVRIVGTGDKAEIWSAELWAERFGNLQAMSADKFNGIFRNINAGLNRK